MRSKRVLGLFLVIVLAVSAFGANLTTAQDAKVLRVSIMGQDNLPTLDPSLAEDVAAVQAIRLLMPGLTNLNSRTVAVEPGMASSWTSEVQADGTVVWTFTLMPDVAWVRYNAESGAVEQLTDADGNPLFVTANDFVYGWQRSLTPTSLSYYGNVLAKWVVGGQAMLDTAQRDADGNVTGVDQAAFDAAVAGLGVVAVDDLTLQVTAPADVAFVPNIYGMWMAVAQPAPIIEAFGDAWFRPENTATYGPFAVKEWQDDVSITFIKNPFWAGTEQIPASAIDEVVNLFLEQPAALANWEAGEIDYINPVNAADLDRVRVDYASNLTIIPGTCTYGYGFNTTKAPFDNVHARRAFSLALDREDITVNVTKGGQIPAAFFTLPYVNAAPQSANYPDAQQLLAADEERIALAQAEWEMYLAEAGGEVPAIAYVTNESATHIAIAEAAQQMWADTLGVDVEIQTLEWATFLDLRENDAPQVFRQAWCYDYPDANNWTYDVFRSDAGSAANGGNEVQWVNEEFDSLILAAQSEPDLAVRTDLYGQAETLLTWTDAVYAPIYYYTTQMLVQSNISFFPSNIGLDDFNQWDVQ
jgi:oligopeptide transport system substrate-binding protein